MCVCVCVCVCVSMCVCVCVTGQEVTDQWYSEVKMHTFGTEPRTLSSGIFMRLTLSCS